MSGCKGPNVMRILEAIPDDDWVRASDMEEKTGLSAYKIGGIISMYLLYDVVERRPVRGNGGSCYEYRRFRVIGG